MSLSRGIDAWVPPGLRSCVRRSRSALAALGAIRGYRARTFFPEEAKKDRARIARELLITSWRWGRLGPVVDTYFAFGLDRRDRKLADYVFLEEFGRIKDALNSHIYDYNSILNNKVVTSILLKSGGIPVPELIGRIEKVGDRLYLTQAGQSHLLRDYLANNDIKAFCKPLAGTGGHGAFRLEVSNGRISADGDELAWGGLEKRLASPMVLEALVDQHEALAALHPRSINTIRIVTVRKDVNEIALLTAFQRIGSGGRSVDNAHSGGIFVPISPAGELMEVGHHKPGFGTTKRAHPDTGIVFKGYRLPRYEESVSLAKRAHAFVGDVHSVGWDIAVTPGGPLIIEANADWDVLMAQQLYGGMREEFEEYFVCRYKSLGLSGR